jgi:hypothetical protein
MQQAVRFCIVAVAAALQFMAALSHAETYPRQVIERLEDGSVNISVYDFRGLRIELQQLDSEGRVLYREKALYNHDGLRVLVIVFGERETVESFISIAYDANAFPISRCDFHGNGQLSRANQYRYDENGKFIGGNLTIFSIDGNHVRHSTNVDSVEAFMPKHKRRNSDKEIHR